MANHSLKESLVYRHLNSLKVLEQRFPQAGSSLKVLLADAGPFWGYGPYRDAFRFTSHGWSLTDEDAAILRQHFQSEVDAVKIIASPRSAPRSTGSPSTCLPRPPPSSAPPSACPTW